MLGSLPGSRYSLAPLTPLFRRCPPQDQVRREITYALRSLPWISVPTVALFFAEVRGYSKLYDNIEDSPYGKPFPCAPHLLPNTRVTSLGAPPFPPPSPRRIIDS